MYTRPLSFFTRREALPPRQTAGDPGTIIVGVFASTQLYEARCFASVSDASGQEANVETSEREMRVTREDLEFRSIADMQGFWNVD